MTLAISRLKIIGKTRDGDYGVDIPFEKEDELQIKSSRLTELNVLLNMDKPDSESIGDEPVESTRSASEDEQDYEYE